MKNAATIAGMEAHLLSEPLAVAIAHGFNQKSERRKSNLLVVDIGGGNYFVWREGESERE